jgi:hypothetical protein
MALALLLLGASAAGVRAQTIRGTLLDRDSNQPIAAARLVMISESGDSVATALTNDRGLFSLSSPRAGGYYLKASSLGYHESTVGIFDLDPAGVMSVEFRLRPQPLTLEEVVVRATGRPVQQGALIRNGFYDRMTTGLGRFLTPDAIGKSMATRITDLFYGLGRVDVVPDGGRFRVLMTNPMGSCVPALYLDGIPLANDGDLEAAVMLPDVEAVEVYRGGAELPLQFGGTSAQGCGAIVIWTKG